MNDKKWIKLRMFTWAFVAVILTVFLVSNIWSYGSSFNYNGFGIVNGKIFSGNNLKTVKEYKFDDVKDLNNISTVISTSDVVFKRNNEDNIKVIVKANKKVKNQYYITASKDKNAIKIQDGKTKNKIFLHGIVNGFYMEVDVLIPDSYEGDLNIKNNVGDVVFDAEFTFDNIDINLNTGDMDIRSRLTANKTNIKNNIGDLDANTLISKDLIIENNTGDVEIESFEGKGSIETDVGDIECNIDKLSGNFKIKSSVGDVDLLIADDVNFKLDANKNFGDIDTNLAFDNVSQSSKYFSGTHGKSSNIITVDVKTGDIGINTR